MTKKDDAPLTPKKLLIIIIEVILVFMIALVLVGVIQQFVITPIGVVGSSMAPTIREENDKVYVYRCAKEYKIGDVIVFYKAVEGENDESVNPSSKKTTFTDFLRALPIVGKKKHASENDDYTQDGYKAIIKRVVATPGDTVCFINGELYVNGEKESRFPCNYKTVKGGVGVGDDYKHTMEKGEYFVLGDNRAVSIDSEDYGPINESMIYGKVVLLVTDGKYKTSF